MKMEATIASVMVGFGTARGLSGLQTLLCMIESFVDLLLLLAGTRRTANTKIAGVIPNSWAGLPYTT